MTVYRPEDEDLVDARDHTIAMRAIADGAPTLTKSEIDVYLTAVTPVSFWRKRSGKTQADFAAELGVSQPFLAEMERGVRDGTVSVLARVAAALRLRIEDLVA